MTGPEPATRSRRLAAMPTSRRLVDRLRARLATILAVAASIAVAGCGAVQNVGLPGTGPLVTVQVQGGMCVQGACDHSVILDRDGHVRSAEKPPNDLGTVSAEAMTTLTAAVAATDYAALRAHPFKGVCPIAFDGQQLIFEFSAPAGTQRIASCEFEIDWGHPLFVAVGVALGEWIPMPLT